MLFVFLISQNDPTTDPIVRLGSSHIKVSKRWKPAGSAAGPGDEMDDCLGHGDGHPDVRSGSADVVLAKPK